MCIVSRYKKKNNIPEELPMGRSPRKSSITDSFQDERRRYDSDYCTHGGFRRNRSSTPIFVTLRDADFHTIRRLFMSVKV